MPRLRTPPDLAQLSMRVLAHTACRALHRLQHLQRLSGQHAGCESHEEAALRCAVQLRDLVAEVPTHLADDFVRQALVLLDALQTRPAARACAGVGAGSDEEEEVLALTTRGLAALLHPRCQTLDLNEPALAACKPQVKFAVLQNVGVLPRLRHLDVKFCSPVGREHEAAGALAVRRVAQHLPRLHHLVSLDVSWICTSAMLRQIATSCPLLQRLVAQDSKLERKDARLLAALTELRWLNVDSHDAAVTPADMAFLLRRLPKLAILEFPDVEGIVAALQAPSRPTRTCALLHLHAKRRHQRRARSRSSSSSSSPLDTDDEDDVSGASSPLSNFGVRDFNCALYRVSQSLLEDLNSLFPRLETLRLYKPATELAVLANFANLRVLSVNECIPEMLTPLLRDAACPSLQELTLHSVSPISSLLEGGAGCTMPRLRNVRLMACQGVDLLALHALCPSLEELKLSQCSATDLSLTAATHARGAFAALQTVKVSGQLTGAHLLLLLSWCHGVKRVTVGAPATGDGVRLVVTDALWLALMRNNPMSQLAKLHLVSDRVTRRVLDELLARLPNLATLYLTGHDWSRELAGPDTIDTLKASLRPFEIKLRIQGAGLYYFSYPEDS